MFGKKQKPIEVMDAELGVPVFTVHTLPYDYDLLDLIHVQITSFSKEAHSQAIYELSRRASEVGADAVIGVAFHVAVVATTHVLHAFGTAVKYVIEEESGVSVVQPFDTDQ
jgi:hypothetical protein